MQIEEWFDVDNKRHLKAYKYLQKHGAWPKNFIPKNIEFSSTWHFILVDKLACKFLENITLDENDF